MFEMGLHDPFRHLKHKLWLKERQIIKLAVWFLTTKSWESTQFPCVQMTCDTLLESFWQGLQLWNLISIGSLHAKLWGPKPIKVPTLGILKLSFRSLGTKCHLDVGLMERYIVYYKGEGDGFPQVWVVVSLVSPNLPVAHPNTKSAPSMH